MRSRLCIHTITTKPWQIEKALTAYQDAGVKGISVWRDATTGRTPTVLRRQIADHGLQTVSYVRGGFFPSTSAQKRQQAIEENKRIIDEAAALGAPLVVMVCGADPEQSLQASVAQIEEGMTRLLPHAAAAGVKLGIEPLHPQYADTRSAIVTLGQANQMAARLNHPAAGVVLDVYHVWWDPDLDHEIERCVAADNLFAFHVCDWRVPTRDALNDRALMGAGCIDIKRIRRKLDTLGYTGFIEVEIFSTAYWELDQAVYLSQIVAAYEQHV
ncbi:MAG: sugar phosphate isomerase/epimerase family protein [Bacteroidota bacterium]